MAVFKLLALTPDVIKIISNIIAIGFLILQDSKSDFFLPLLYYSPLNSLLCKTKGHHLLYLVKGVRCYYFIYLWWNSTVSRTQARKYDQVFMPEIHLKEDFSQMLRNRDYDILQRYEIY